MQIPPTALRVLNSLPPSVTRRIEQVIDKVPGVRGMVSGEKKKLAASLRAEVRKHRPTELATGRLPATGLKRELLLKTLKTLSGREDPKWRDGRVSGGVYHGDEAHLGFQHEVYALFSQANPLHGDVWPSVVRFEAELVSMTAQILGSTSSSPDDADAICGTLSSGGTESIMLAMKAYRDHGRAVRGIRHGNLVMPASAHPAFTRPATRWM